MAAPTDATAAAGPDYFRRQKNTKLWNQERVSGRTALLLGVGGLGSTIAMDCCRLGYKRLLLVDKDVVDDHNINRQVLYSKEHVGQRKVEVAARTVQHHNVQTQVEAYHFDILAEWQRVVELARQADIIYNTVDVGDYYTYAVTSLALKLGIPMVDGGTEPMLGHLMITSLTRPGGRPCWACLHPLGNAEVLARIGLDKILAVERLDFLPGDLHWDGGSNVYSCGMCSHMMVAMGTEYLLGIEGVPTQVLFNLVGFDLEKWTPTPEPTCKLCGRGDADDGAAAATATTATGGTDAAAASTTAEGAVPAAAASSS